MNREERMRLSIERHAFLTQVGICLPSPDPDFALRLYLTTPATRSILLQTKLKSCICVLFPTAQHARQPNRVDFEQVFVEYPAHSLQSTPLVPFCAILVDRPRHRYERGRILCLPIRNECFVRFRSVDMVKHINILLSEFENKRKQPEPTVVRSASHLVRTTHITHTTHTHDYIGEKTGTSLYMKRQTPPDETPQKRNGGRTNRSCPSTSSSAASVAYSVHSPPSGSNTTPLRKTVPRGPGQNRNPPRQKKGI